MLKDLATCPFLPVASDHDENPIYLENNRFSERQYSEVLLQLEQKRLITIDYDMPLMNYDYNLYKEYDNHGSIALTGLGQNIIDAIDSEI